MLRTLSGLAQSAVRVSQNRLAHFGGQRGAATIAEETAKELAQLAKRIEEQEKVVAAARLGKNFYDLATSKTIANDVLRSHTSNGTDESDDLSRKAYQQS